MKVDVRPSSLPGGKKAVSKATQPRKPSIHEKWLRFPIKRRKAQDKGKTKGRTRANLVVA